MMSNEQVSATISASQKIVHEVFDKKGESDSIDPVDKSDHQLCVFQQNNLTLSVSPRDMHTLPSTQVTLSPLMADEPEAEIREINSNKIDKEEEQSDKITYLENQTQFQTIKLQQVPCDEANSKSQEVHDCFQEEQTPRFAPQENLSQQNVQIKQEIVAQNEIIEQQESEQKRNFELKELSHDNDQTSNHMEFTEPEEGVEDALVNEPPQVQVQSKNSLLVRKIRSDYSNEQVTHQQMENLYSLEQKNNSIDDDEEIIQDYESGGKTGGKSSENNQQIFSHDQSKSSSNGQVNSSNQTGNLQQLNSVPNGLTSFEYCVNNLQGTPNPLGSMPLGGGLIRASKGMRNLQRAELGGISSSDNNNLYGQEASGFLGTSFSSDPQFFPQQKGQTLNNLLPQGNGLPPQTHKIIQFSSAPKDELQRALSGQYCEDKSIRDQLGSSSGQEKVILRNDEQYRRESEDCSSLIKGRGQRLGQFSHLKSRIAHHISDMPYFNPSMLKQRFHNIQTANRNNNVDASSGSYFNPNSFCMDPLMGQNQPSTGHAQLEQNKSELHECKSGTRIQRKLPNLAAVGQDHLQKSDAKTQKQHLPPLYPGSKSSSDFNRLLLHSDKQLRAGTQNKLNQAIFKNPADFRDNIKQRPQILSDNSPADIVGNDYDDQDHPFSNNTQSLFDGESASLNFFIGMHEEAPPPKINTLIDEQGQDSSLEQHKNPEAIDQQAAFDQNVIKREDVNADQNQPLRQLQAHDYYSDSFGVEQELALDLFDEFDETTGMPNFEGQENCDSINPDQAQKRIDGIMALYMPWNVRNLLVTGYITKIYLTKNVQGQRVIVKTIEKDLMQGEKLAHEFAKRECEIHSQLDHPNIIKMFHQVELQERYVLFMDYAGLNADQLARKIGKGKPISDQVKLKKWARQLLEAISYLHEREIIHQDLKLENILVSEDNQIKLIDFGLCNRLKPGTNYAFMEIKVGTHGYQAPEVLNGSYVTTAIDMWAYGILLYELAVAYKPQDIKLQNNSENQYASRYLPDWRRVDSKLYSLICDCLQQDPKQRITAKQALKHPYLQFELEGRPLNSQRQLQPTQSLIAESSQQQPLKSERAPIQSNQQFSSLQQLEGQVPKNEQSQAQILKPEGFLEEESKESQQPTSIQKDQSI